MYYTIGILARKHGLSRSKLLYYDSIGLLSPDSHSRGDYRQYGLKKSQRLEQICHYRQFGLSLKDIKSILDSDQSDLNDSLTVRFNELTEEIMTLRH